MCSKGGAGIGGGGISSDFMALTIGLAQRQWPENVSRRPIGGSDGARQSCMRAGGRLNVRSRDRIPLPQPTWRSGRDRPQGGSQRSDEYLCLNPLATLGIGSVLCCSALRRAPAQIVWAREGIGPKWPVWPVGTCFV